MCVGLLMHSIASVCEVYTDDINMGVDLNVLWLNWLRCTGETRSG